MKVSLIFTPNQLNPNYKEVAFRDESLGFVPPLSLLCVAALLEKEGVNVDLIDMDAERLGYPEVLERITTFAPDLLGFTITTMSFHPVLKWIRRFKEGTGLPVLVGGEHVRLYPHETMSHPAIDFCIVGEAERPLPEFVRAFRDGSPFDGIRSLGFRKNGELYIDRTIQAVDDIDAIPFPARHLIRNELYENILTRKKNFTAMISSRGCPFKCAFCNANHQKYRVRSAVNFVDEIELNFRQHGIRDFDIYDSTFTADRQRVMDICAEIGRRKLEVGFSVRSRVDVVTREMIDSLRGAGCHTIMYGIESSNPEILARMHKGISPGLVAETIRYTRQSGIKTLGFFLFGFPGETRETIEDTIRFSLDLPLDYAQFSLLLPLPDTEIYAYYRKRGLEDYWAEYTLDESKDELVELMDTGVTREEVSEYITTAYRRFYFRPKIIWNRLKNLGSFRELRRLAGGAIGILTNVGGRNPQHSPRHEG
ncbi:B12-binding domain-containing radical SAM protein [Geobacter sp. AOG1]|uniref:B12-binding domain-containing radical SAM protein n=1 Tax=Geobacter sp. AOG1 TaxID=1566346 RepID=UPI001CC590B5|nr:radical SAM protein [Geobacter sp. AOG1]GFE56440.1 B12-binding domain-containing radical SAM protein [Geobacter sp. AOG1]